MSLCLVALMVPLDVGAQVLNPKRVVYQVDPRTINSNGGGTPATLTLTPVASYVTLTCNDPDGCTITMGESGIPDGLQVVIANVSANTCTFSDSSGVSELNGTVALSQYQALTLEYVTDRWVQTAGAGTTTVGQGGTGITSGTSGGVPYFASTSTMASSGALTANLPVIGGGAGSAPSVGTRSGNTTKFGTVNGSFTTGNCLKADVNGNIVDHGSACGTGGSATSLLMESGGESKITDLSADTSPTTDDLIVTVNDPGGTPANKKVTLGAVGTLTRKVVQVANTETGAVATGTTQMPADDSIPQNTEGDEYMTLAITPTASGNKLRIDVVFYFAHSVNARYITVALFQDSTANALAAGVEYIDTAAGPKQITFTHYMTAGTTSSTTFKVRAGGHSTGTLTFNGTGGGRLYGGVLASSITITEIVP